MFTERTNSPHAIELFDQLRAAHANVIAAEAERDQLARQAANAGLQWRYIGEALGISPQAAHRRYHSDSVGVCWAWTGINGAGKQTANGELQPGAHS